MRSTFALLYFLGIFSVADAQKNTSTASPTAHNITGIWKGYFVQNNLGFFEDKYRFEVQIAQQPDNALESVTYSYKTTVFYGKAEATGIFTNKTSNVLLKETKLVDLKITEENTGACLMTCYMEYNKVGKSQTLTGTYTSVSVKDGADCGSGKVYLEKVETSDFYKEDFVTKREKELKKAKGTAKHSSPQKSVPKNALATAKGAKQPERKPVAKIPPKRVVPHLDSPVTNLDKSFPEPPPAVVLKKKKETEQPVLQPPVVKLLPKPDIIKNRENNLVKTITTSEKEFKVQLYDNGEIDGDRISVYHNNELIVSNQMLTDKPITFTIHCDETVPVHEFVMVAENLGTIPPNTALMIITAGSKRYELTISSTEQKNAVVKVQYEQPDFK